MIAVLLSIVGSLVPARYRGKFTPEQEDHSVLGATLSSFIQCFGSLVLIMTRFVMLINERAALAQQQIFTQTPDKTVVVAGHGAGIMLYVEYMLQPLTLLLWYFAI